MIEQMNSYGKFLHQAFFPMACRSGPWYEKSSLSRLKSQDLLRDQNTVNFPLSHDLLSTAQLYLHTFSDISAFLIITANCPRQFPLAPPCCTRPRPIHEKSHHLGPRLLLPRPSGVEDLACKRRWGCDEGCVGDDGMCGFGGHSAVVEAPSQGMSV